jgi:leader peptidase (prepilin peptidase)/N-methyltransferase
MSVFIFIIGTIIGSFLNVCIYRIPRKESIVFPSSHCPNCSTPLKWYELVPVFSFLVQGGKCRYCREKISLQYPLIELLNGFLYILVYQNFGLSIDLIFYCSIISILVIISVIDYYTQTIPDSLVLVLLIISIIHKITLYLLYGTSPQILNSSLGLLISGGLFLLVAIISKGGMGGGDIKLIAVLGFILGFRRIFLNIFISFVIGAIISIFLLAFKVKNRKDPIPFGPFLCIAFVITLFWGNELINWYLIKFF